MARIAHADVVIVGAGIAGPMAANALTAQGRRVIVVEKGPRVGGLLSTEAIGPGRADSGAQFFTARSDTFRDYVARWMDAGLVFEWSLGWSDGSLGATPPTGHPRYAVRGGMGALAEHLARGRDVRLDTWIVSAMPDASGWIALRPGRCRVRGGCLAVDSRRSRWRWTCSRAATRRSRPPIAPRSRRSVLAVPGRDLLGQRDGPVARARAVQRPNATITWIADNRSRGSPVTPR